MQHAPPLALDLAAEFPVLGELDFLNHAAVAPMSGRAARAMCEAAEGFARRSFLVSDWYPQAQRVRRLAAQMIHARGPHEIAFIPNTTTGLATLAGGLDWSPGDRVVITDAEYPSNRYPWTALKACGVEVVEAKQGDDLRIDVQQLVGLINERTRVVSVSHVQFATGFRIDLRPIAEAVHAVGGLLCVDAIQTVGLMPVDVQALGIDFLAADGHKWMLGPEGAGVLYCHEQLAGRLTPPISGWMGRVNARDFLDYDERYLPDARRFEPGCWNVIGLHGLGASLDLLLEVGVEAVWARVDLLNEHLRAGLAARGCVVASPSGPDERSGSVCFLPPEGHDPAAVVSHLESQGIAVALRDGRLRVSPHFYNSLEQIDRLLEAVPV